MKELTQVDVKIMWLKIQEKIRIKNVYVREFLSELLGTFILLLCGNSVVAQVRCQILFMLYSFLPAIIFLNQVILSEGLGNPKGDFFVMNWGWGFGLSVAILVSGGVSGAHFNPAITLALAFVGKLL